MKFTPKVNFVSFTTDWKGNGGAMKPRRPYKKGIERDKKARIFHINNWPACPIGDISDRKRPQPAQKARRHSGNKDRSDWHKDRNCCPYANNKLKANEKGPRWGLYLSVTSKIIRNAVKTKDKYGTQRSNAVRPERHSNSSGSPASRLSRWA